MPRPPAPANEYGLPASKHAAFVRLMQARLDTAAEALRLISQLSSKHYANTQDEAAQVVKLLSGGLQEVADRFGVPFTTAIGQEAVDAAKRTGFGRVVATGSPISEVDIVKAMEMIHKNQPDKALIQLRAALQMEAR